MVYDNTHHFKYVGSALFSRHAFLLLPSATSTAVWAQEKFLRAREYVMDLDLYRGGVSYSMSVPHH
jgi:hypothetical protein